MNRCKKQWYWHGTGYHYITGSRPLFTKRTDVLSQDLAKWLREILVLTFSMALKFDRHLGSAAEMPVKFQSNTIIMTPNLALWCGCLTCCRTFWQYLSALEILRTRWIEIGCSYTLMLSTGCVGICVFFLLLLFFWDKKKLFLVWSPGTKNNYTPVLSFKFYFTCWCLPWT